MDIKKNMDIDTFNENFFDEKLNDDFLLDENYYIKLFSNENLVKYLNSELYKWDLRLVFCRGRAYYYGKFCKWEIITNDTAQCIISRNITHFLNIHLVKNKQLKNAMNNLPKPENEKQQKSQERFLNKQYSKLEKYTEDEFEVDKHFKKLKHLLTDNDLENKLNRCELINCHRRDKKTKFIQHEDFVGEEREQDYYVDEACAIDLRTGEIHDRSPEHYLTSETLINLNHFDSEENKDHYTSSVEELIRPILGKDKMKGMFSALILALRLSPLPFFMVNQGSGQNGKTLLFDFVKNTFGNEFVKDAYNDFFYEGSSKDQGYDDLFGARIVMAEELKDKQVDISFLKLVSTHHEAKFKAKYIQELQNAYWTGKVFINKNKMINLGEAGDDGGIKRRMNTCKFETTFFGDENDICKGIKYNKKNENHKIGSLEVNDDIQNPDYQHGLFFYLLNMSIENQKDEDLLKILHNNFMKETMEVMDSQRPEYLDWIDNELEIGTQEDFILWKDWKKRVGVRNKTNWRDYIKNTFNGIYKDRTSTYRDIIYGVREKEKEINDDELD